MKRGKKISVWIEVEEDNFGNDMPKTNVRMEETVPEAGSWSENLSDLEMALDRVLDEARDKTRHQLVQLGHIEKAGQIEEDKARVG